MSQINISSNRGPGIVTGILIMLMGFAILAISFGIIPIDASNVQAPGWVLVVFGASFVVAGLWAIILRIAKQDSASAGWVNFLFALFVLLAMSIICLWIGFGPGQRVFVHYGTFSARNPALITDPTLGRIIFGVCGILMSGMTIIIAIVQGRKLLGER